MKVVLIEEVESLGIPGDVREVKDGFARNYLLPRRLAVVATPAELSRAESRRRAELARRERLNVEMSTVAERLQTEPLTVEARVGPGGRLYGSVTATEIAEALSARIGLEVDRRAVELAQPLRELGEHAVRVRLAPDVAPTIAVVVQPLGGTPPKPQESGAPPAKSAASVETEPSAETEPFAEEQLAEDEEPPDDEEKEREAET